MSNLYYLYSNTKGLIQMMETALLFSPRTGKQKPHKEQDILEQMKKFTSILTQTGSLDLVSNLITKPEIKSVIPVQLEYFTNQSPADIIDGQFVVLGKIVRFIEKKDESVDLLRGTPLTYLPKESRSEVMEAFNVLSPTLSDTNEITTKINGPALLVIPIAIYA